MTDDDHGDGDDTKAARQTADVAPEDIPPAPDADAPDEDDA